MRATFDVHTASVWSGNCEWIGFLLKNHLCVTVFVVLLFDIENVFRLVFLLPMLLKAELG